MKRNRQAKSSATQRKSFPTDELAEEIEEQEKTFKKISTKLDPMIKELMEMGTTAGNLKRSMEDEQKTVEAMEKEVSKTAGGCEGTQGLGRQFERNGQDPETVDNARRGSGR